MIAYINNAGYDVSTFHAIIMAAMDNGGSFDGDFADIFILTKTPPGSAAKYTLSFVGDKT